MNKILLSFVAAILLFSSCTKKGIAPVVNELKTVGIDAVGAYFTKDHTGKPVLCWMEQAAQDSLYELKYAVYNQQNDQFGPAISVPASKGCNTSAESMGKIAFKADGSVIAIFAKRFPEEKSPYAGAIYYSLSPDQGKTWSDAIFLHTDTVHNYGRSFFDVTTLKNGEVAAVWLDGRYGKSIKGSALFFSRTEKGKGFGKDTCLDKGTCECCRTDLLTDGAGNLHLAYRSINFPSALSEKQVRDMSYKLSADNGDSFSDAITISNDNWEIMGCPHSGPSLAVTGNKVEAVWFTAGGGPGLYYTSSSGQGQGFEKRSLITASGKHPQMSVLTDGSAVMVCEEPENKNAEKPMDMNHSKHGGMSSHPPAGTAKIILRTLKKGATEKSVVITNGHYAENHAVISVLNDRVLLAWVREGDKGAKIHYANVNMKE